MKDYIKPFVPNVIYPIAQNIYDYLIFSKVRNLTDGKMKPQVYAYINYLAKHSYEYNILEIGAYRGGSTISAAKALKETQSESRVYSFEKQNIEHLTRNINSAGVENFVSVINDEVYSTEYKMPEIIKENAPYSMIIIDADGEIFKYIYLFQEYLIPGSVIVIDDYKPIRPFNRESGGKDYRTYLQTNMLVREGVIDKFRIKRHTFFGTISVDSPDLNIIESKMSDLYAHEEKIRKCEF